MDVAPVPAALHWVRYQLPLMQGYLQAPELHWRAATNPKMSGGAFIGVPPGRSGELRSLMQRSLAARTQTSAVAEALESLEQMLVTEAHGESLQPYYPRVPAPVRGLVELVYDYRSRPSVRLLESAAYNSLGTSPKLQAFQLSRYANDDRPSWLSTPRLEAEGAVQWNVPFTDPRVRAFFEADTSGVELETLRELIGVDANLPEGFFIESESPRTPRYEGPLRARYLGHATVLLEWKGGSVLVDPVIAPAIPGSPRWSFGDLPEHIDVVVITHAHADHFCLESLLRLRHRIGRLVVPRASGALLGDVSLALMARELGFKDVVEVAPYDALPVAGGQVLAVPFFGEHGDLAHAKSGYLVNVGSQSILFAADSACVEPELYRQLRRHAGDVHSVFMNTESEGSPLTFSIEALFPRGRDRKLDKTRLCRGSTAEEGLALLDAVGAKRLFNYAMGLEPWLEYITGPVDRKSPRMMDSDKLIQTARAKGLEASRLDGQFEIEFGK